MDMWGKRYGRPPHELLDMVSSDVAINIATLTAGLDLDEEILKKAAKAGGARVVKTVG